jgi:hypothetical protein
MIHGSVMNLKSFVKKRTWNDRPAILKFVSRNCGETRTSEEFVRQYEVLTVFQILYEFKEAGQKSLAMSFQVIKLIKFFLTQI